MIHPSARIGDRPFWYDRDPNTGRRTERDVENLGTFIHQTADVFPLAAVVAGTKRTTRVNEGARIGPQARIGHDASIGKHTVVGAGAIVCGFATVGDRCTIGVGAIVCPHVTIGNDCFVGAGVLIDRDMPENTRCTVRGERENWEVRPWISP